MKTLMIIQRILSSAGADTYHANLGQLSRYFQFFSSILKYIYIVCLLRFFKPASYVRIGITAVRRGGNTFHHLHEVKAEVIESAAEFFSRRLKSRQYFLPLGKFSNLFLPWEQQSNSKTSQV